MENIVEQINVNMLHKKKILFLLGSTKSSSANKQIVLLLMQQLGDSFEVCLILKRQPTAQNGTFGFARHTNHRFAKPKEPFFCNRTDRQKL